MGEMADYAMEQEFNLTHLPETHRRNGWGKFTYVDENGVKHYFKTIKQAQAWAKSKGFRLTTTAPTDKKGKTE